MTALWRVTALPALMTLAASPALAQFERPITVISAPAPIAGAGLPILLIAGGYALVQRFRGRTKAK